MKLNVESKQLIDAIQTVASTTGSATVNLEVGKRGSVYLKASAKGCSHHILTDFMVEDASKGFKVELNVAQVTGLINRKGSILVEATEDNILRVSNSKFNADVVLVPATDIMDIEPSASTISLLPDTLEAIASRVNYLCITNMLSPTVPLARIHCKNGLLQLGMADSVHFAYWRISVDPEQADFEFDLEADLLKRMIGAIVSDPNSTFAVEEARVFVSGATSSISFPKQQGGKLMPLTALHTLSKNMVDSKASHIRGVNLETFLEELSGCTHIAIQNTTVQVVGGTKGKGYKLSYQTKLGNYTTKGSCTSEWVKGDTFNVNPFLLTDLLNTLGEHQEFDLSVVSDNACIHYKGDGYESFHVCQGVRLGSA